MKKPTKEQVQEYVNLPEEDISMLIRSKRPQNMEFKKYKEYLRTMKMLTNIQLNGFVRKTQTLKEDVNN